MGRGGAAKVCGGVEGSKSLTPGVNAVCAVSRAAGQQARGAGRSAGLLSCCLPREGACCRTSAAKGEVPVPSPGSSGHAAAASHWSVPAFQE